LKYRFISQRRDYPVAKWARFLKVSRSGYYTWFKCHERREEKLATYVTLIRSVFEEGEGTYGAERISGVMRRRGHKASFGKVAACMNREGLRSIHNRRGRRSLTDSRKSRGEGYANLTAETDVSRPFQIISSDISYIRTGEGFEYLCHVKDVKSGTVLGYSMSDRMKSELVEQAIRRAVKCWAIPAGCIFHSDRGSQYTSAVVGELLSRNGIRQSFSRVGKPGDNAWSESFFANLKKESVHWVHFKTRAEARQAMFEYIEGFYNTRRVQKRLGYLSPMGWLENGYRENSIMVA